MVEEAQLDRAIQMLKDFAKIPLDYYDDMEGMKWMLLGQIKFARAILNVMGVEWEKTKNDD